MEPVSMKTVVQPRARRHFVPIMQRANSDTRLLIAKSVILRVDLRNGSE
jgi:hypothetical protein